MADRGRLLLQGVDETGPGAYTYTKQLTYLGVWLLLALLAGLLASYSWDVPMAGSVTLNRISKAGIILMPILVLLFFVPLEIDGIWANGISARRTMIHRLLGRCFLEYGQVEAVRIDKMSLDSHRWLRVTLSNRRNTASLHFGDEEHSNGFYQELLGVLERRCPNARWLESCVYITKWGREVTRKPGP